MSFGAIAGIVGGIGSIIGSSSAADAQENAAETAADVQWRMYNQSRDDQAPYRDVGTNALYGIADLYGLGYGTDPATVSSQPAPAPTPVPTAIGATRGPVLPPGYGLPTQGESDSDWMADIRTRYRESPQATGALPAPAAGGAPGGTPGGRYSAGDRQLEAMEKFFTSPDYTFRRDEGIKGIENSMLARGRGLSGATGKALARYSGDLASGEYNNYVNRLASLAGIGQSSANNMAAIGSNTANAVGQASIAAGQARGSGYTGMASGLNNMMGNLYYANQYGGGGSPWGTWGGGGSSYTPATGYSNTGSAGSSDNWADFI